VVNLARLVKSGSPERVKNKGEAMEIIIFLMVIATVGIAAAALGGVFAIYASKQD
jgi:hypothetical protein